MPRVAEGTWIARVCTYRRRLRAQAVFLRCRWNCNWTNWDHAGTANSPGNTRGKAMKIWYGYGSEHSMRLVMIGHFREVTDAERAKEAIDRLTAQVSADVDS